MKQGTGLQIAFFVVVLRDFCPLLYNNNKTLFKMIKTSAKGTVKKIYDLVQYSEKFSKRMIVLETDDQYNNEIAIDFINEKIGLLNRVEQGQKITVFCDVFSRPSTKNPDQYFTNVKGWKIEHDDEYIPPIAEQETTEELDDGLPF